MGKTTTRGSRRDSIAEQLDGVATAIAGTPLDDGPPEQGEPEVPALPPADVRITLGSWDYAVRIGARADVQATIFTVYATPRKRAMRAFALRAPIGEFAGGPVAGLALNPGAHALYALSGQGKSRTLSVLHDRVAAHPVVAVYADHFDELAPVVVSIPDGVTCLAAQAGEPDGRYDPLLAGMAAGLAWALSAPGRLLTVDSVTDLSRASGDGGTMGGGLSSGFATDLRHLSAALLARGSAALLVVNPLAEGSAAGLFREVLFGSLTGLWVPAELGAAAPTGQQRGPTRSVSSALWGATAPAQRAPGVTPRATGLLVPELAASEASFGLPFGHIVRPFTY